MLPERIAEECDRAGISQDSPSRLIQVLLAQRMDQVIAAAEKAQALVTPEALRKIGRDAASGADRRAGELARAYNYRFVTLAACALVVALLVGAAAGYWLHGSDMLSFCAAHGKIGVDGGRPYCAVSFYLR